VQAPGGAEAPGGGKSSVTELVAARPGADFPDSHFCPLLHPLADHESVTVLNILTETWVRLEFRVTPTKQRIGVLSNRNKNGGEPVVAVSRLVPSFL
jgi:hypothetical protein